jgi:hypothetical protein
MVKKAKIHGFKQKALFEEDEDGKLIANSFKKEEDKK